MKEKSRTLQEYSNDLLLKQSGLKEALIQKQANLEKMQEERDNSIPSVSLGKHKIKVLNEEIGSIDKQYNDLLTGRGRVRAEIEQLVTIGINMKQKYNDLSTTNERLRTEISQLEVNRGNAQNQYNNILATNAQIKVEIASMDNAKITYNSMINHNGSTNSQIYNLKAQLDHIENQQIKPYIDALEKARNTIGTIKKDNYNYNVKIGTKHKTKVLFWNGEPYHTYHTETRCDETAYYEAVASINTIISTIESQLNIQKAIYKDQIEIINTQITTKQLSLYSPQQIQQALQTLNTAQDVLAARSVTLDISEQQVAEALQNFNETSYVLSLKQVDLNNNEQQKGQVAEVITMTNSKISVRENDVRIQEQKANETNNILKEKQAVLTILEEESANNRQELESLEYSLSNIREEIIAVEEECRTNEFEITATEKKIEVQRLELEKIAEEEEDKQILEQAQNIKEEESDDEDVLGGEEAGKAEVSLLNAKVSVNMLGQDFYNNELDVSYSDI